MKNFYVLVVALVAALPKFSSACVDYHPNTVQFIVSGDSSCNLEVRVTNLNMFGGNPNQFCSCGIINSFNGLGYEFVIDYVAFVDSITGVPVEGFDPFGLLAASSDSWEEVDPDAFDWTGFVAEVNSSGILAGQSVDLVIRGHYINADCMLVYQQLNEEFFYLELLQGGFGTDEWNSTGDSLALSHNDITYFADVYTGANFEANQVSSNYFDYLDGIFLGIVDLNKAQFMLYPNPAYDLLTIARSNYTNATILVSDMNGNITKSFSNINSLLFSIQLNDIEAGVYVVQVITAEGKSVSRFVKN